MNKGPINPNGNGLLDVLLKGLKLTGDLNKATLGVLSQVSTLYKTRIEKDFIWQKLLSDDDTEQKNTLGMISAKDLAKINAVVRALGHEIPSHQPSSDSQWDYYLSVPRKIKTALVALYPMMGPELLNYVPALCTPHSEELNSLLSWLQALQDLYKSAHDETDLFHGLFLNNHNFTKRAYELANSTDIQFSTVVLRVCADCRFSSLTMNSLQLNGLFKDFADVYKTNHSKKRQYSRAFGDDTLAITQDELKDIVKQKYYPKTLLWRSKQEAVVDVATPPGRPSLPLSLDDEPENRNDHRSPSL